MTSWMEIVLFNAASATLLAVVVALLAKRIKHAAVVHVLWLVVLLKLISPPVFEVALLPRSVQEALRPSSQSAASVVGSAAALQAERNLHAPQHETDWAATVAGGVGLREEDAPMTPRQPGLAWLIAAFAACGTLLLLALAIGRIVRFQRRIRDAPEAPAALQARAERLARVFDLKHTPRIRMVSGRIPPSVWPGPGPCEILLPAELLPQLSDQECDTLLAHELAHVKRRDHWLRPLELSIVALYWWHPVAWWAQRNLRVAEEASCDVMVVRRLASRSRIYVESLLKTVEFLARTDQAVPLMATGAIGTARLKERVTMILKTNTPAPLPGKLRPLLAAALLVPILVTPAWVAKAPENTIEENAEWRHQQEMLEIQKAEIKLQKELRLLENDRARVQLAIEERMHKRHLEEMQKEIDALQQEGRHSEAEELRRRIALVEREAQLHRQEVEREQLLAEKRMQIEFELQELALQRHAAETASDLERAQELMQRSFKLEQDLRRLELQAMESALESQRARLKLEEQELQGFEK